MTPTLAVLCVAAIAAVLGLFVAIAVYALVGCLQAESRHWRRESERWRRGLLDIAVDATDTLAGALRPLPPPDPETVTCERVLVALLETNGRFPWTPSGDGGRQLVREVRKIYEELNLPTQEPEGGYRDRGAGSGNGGAGDSGEGDEAELFLWDGNDVEEDDFARVEEGPDAF